MPQLVPADPAVRELQKRYYSNSRQVKLPEIIALAEGWNAEANSASGKDRASKRLQAMYFAEEAHRRDRSGTDILPVAREIIKGLGEEYVTSKYRALYKAAFPAVTVRAKPAPRDIVLYERDGREPILLEKFGQSEAAGLLSAGQVMEVLDRIPGKLFHYVPLKRIVFHAASAYLLFDGFSTAVKASPGKAESLQRLRVTTRHDGRDGTERIELYSTKKWDGTSISSVDSKEAGAGIYIGFGSEFVRTILCGAHLRKVQEHYRLYVPYRIAGLTDLQPLISEWKSLPLPDHPEYREGRNIDTVIYEHREYDQYLVSRDEPLEDFLLQRDFGLSFRHLLLEHDLQMIDPRRFDLLTRILAAVKD